MTFIDEIKQQPGALMDLKCLYNEAYLPAIELANLIRRFKYNNFIFTGMGSSYFVGYIACALLRKNGIRAYAYETKEFTAYGMKTIEAGALLFVISQSGESKEVLDLMPKLHITDNVVIVTNNTNSALYQFTGLKFILNAGMEYTTATKTYTNTIAAVLYISNIILKCMDKPVIDFESQINKCADIMRVLIENGVSEMSKFFENAGYICLVGGGASYCTASHAELVVEEAGKMYATRYLPAQFLHGPVELINKGFCIVAFDFSDDTRVEIDRIIDNTLTYGGKICVVTNREIMTADERLLCVKLDMPNEFYSPLVEIMPVELFVNEIGLQRGLNPGVLTRVRK